MGFVAVHVGAGYHSRKSEPELKRCIALACRTAIECIKEGHSSDEACTRAIEILENDPITNAGYGSSLTRDGFIECDAALINGIDGRFGAVGACPGVKNPIRVAQQLVTDQNQHGKLAAPLLLSGRGAYEFAKDRGLEVFPLEGENEPFQSKLISKEALERYHKHIDVYQNNVNDTVGAVCVDSSGNVAAGVSSGGISLKHRGRIGDSAVFGCGCWAEQDSHGLGFGASTTGLGEQLIYSMFAKSLAEARQDTELSALLYSFLERFGGEREASAGFISVRTEGEGRGELWYGHTTKSMALGYQSTLDREATCLVSRKSDDSPFSLSASSFKFSFISKDAA